MAILVTGANRRISYAQTAGRVANTELYSIGVTSFGIGESRDFQSEPTLAGNRANGISVPLNRTVAGNIAFVYKPGTHTKFFDGVLGNTRAVGLNKSNGKTVLPFLFESVQTDAAVPYSQTYADCVVNTFSIKADNKSFATVEFGFLGTDYLASTTLFDSTPTLTVETAPATHLNCVYRIGGVAIATVSEFQLDGTNNGASDNRSGQVNASNYFKNFSASGSFKVLAQDLSLITAYLNTTRQTMAVDISNGVKKDTWTVTNMVITGISNPLDNDGLQELSVTFNADPDANGVCVTHLEA